MPLHQKKKPTRLLYGVQNKAKMDPLWRIHLFVQIEIHNLFIFSLEKLDMINLR